MKPAISGFKKVEMVSCCASKWTSECVDPTRGFAVVILLSL